MRLPPWLRGAGGMSSAGRSSAGLGTSRISVRGPPVVGSWIVRVRRCHAPHCSNTRICPPTLSVDCPVVFAMPRMLIGIAPLASAWSRLASNSLATSTAVMRCPADRFGLLSRAWMRRSRRFNSALWRCRRWISVVGAACVWGIIKAPKVSPLWSLVGVGRGRSHCATMFPLVVTLVGHTKNANAGGVLKISWCCSRNGTDVQPACVLLLTF